MINYLIDKVEGYFGERRLKFWPLSEVLLDPGSNLGGNNELNL